MQPAITALIAIFSTVAGASAGGTRPITSCGSRAVPSSMRSTRSSVGGTSGNPSDQPRANIASCSSSSPPISMRRDFRPVSLKRTLRRSMMPGSTFLAPQPGCVSGRSCAETGDAGQTLPFGAVPAKGARRLAPALEPDQGRHDLDPETVRHVEVEIGSRATAPFPENRDRPAYRPSARRAAANSPSTGAVITQVGQSRLTIATRPSCGRVTHRDAPLPFRGSMNPRRRDRKSPDRLSRRRPWPTAPARSRRFAATWRSPSQAASAVIDHEDHAAEEHPARRALVHDVAEHQRPEHAARN